MAYRAILANRDIQCEQYTMTDHGVELYDDETFLAFVPYHNLHSLVDEDATERMDPSIL